MTGVISTKLGGIKRAYVRPAPRTDVVNPLCELGDVKPVCSSSAKELYSVASLKELKSSRQVVLEGMLVYLCLRGRTRLTVESASMRI